MAQRQQQQQKQHLGECKCCLVHHGDTQQSLDEMDFDRGMGGAALRGDVSRLRHLLGRPGADANERSAGGYTPLMYAARSGHVEACRVLLQAGADPNLTTTGGKATALHRAAGAGKADVVRLLIQNGAHVQILDADGLTPAMRAEKAGHSQVLAILGDEQITFPTMQT